MNNGSLPGMKCSGSGNSLCDSSNKGFSLTASRLNTSFISASSIFDHQLVLDSLRKIFHGIESSAIGELQEALVQLLDLIKNMLNTSEDCSAFPFRELHNLDKGTNLPGALDFPRKNKVVRELSRPIYL